MPPQRRTISDELGSLFAAELGRRSVGGRTEATHVYEGGKRPPDVIQILEDPYYLGGQISLEPEVRDLLWDIEDPEVREVDLEVGKFGAKSTVAAITQLVGIIQCLHLVNPQHYFGLDASTIISCVTVSINRDQARLVVFQRIRDLVSKSPYFQALQPNICRTWIEFPKNVQILCGHSGSTAQLGMGTLRAAMDETNYMVDNDNRNVAHELYDMLSDSMTTRFPQHHKLIAISSVTMGSTWLHQRVTQSQTEGEVYARRIPDLQAQEQRPLGGGESLLKVVCDREESRASLSRTLAMEHQLSMVDAGAWRRDGERWSCDVAVKGRLSEAVPGRRLAGKRPEQPDPERPTKLARELIADGSLKDDDWREYASLRITRHRYRHRLSVVSPTWMIRSVRPLDEFLPALADPLKRESARMNFASIVGSAQRPYFRVPDLVRRGAQPDRVCPIHGVSDQNEVSSGEALIPADWFEPVADAVYAFAADLSVSGDKTGVALVHFEEAKAEEALPRFVVDFSFRVVAPRGGRIDYEPIRQLARDLRARGFRIGRVGFDQFQSNDSAVMLTKEGFVVEIVKHADSLAGCDLLHAFITAGQLVYGTCDAVFIGEAVELQVKNSRRIDHQDSGGRYNSKDVWDAVVNATYLAQQLSRDEHGEFLHRRDLATYDPAEAFAPLPLTAEQRLLTPAERRARQLPNNGYVLMAYVYCRFGAATDADAIAIVLGAIDRRNNHCRLMAAQTGRWAPADLAARLVDLERAWRDRGFYRYSSEQSMEVFIPEEQGELERTLAELAPDLSLLRSRSPFAPDIGIKAAQVAARDRRVSVPVEITPVGEGHALEAAITQLVNYPFTPSFYLALAVEGLVREAEAADFTEATDRSRVVARIA